MLLADHTRPLTIDECRREAERLRQQARLYEGVGERATAKAMRERIAELEQQIAQEQLSS